MGDTTFSFDVQKESVNCLMAVPKKGRLYERVIKLLEGAGLDYHRPNRLDVAHCTSLPVTLVFLPAADIASYVAEGNVDIGITGTDCVREARAEVDEILTLGFGSCKLCLQAPISSRITDPSQLAGMRIVTSFPNLSRDYFDQFDTAEKKTSKKKLTPHHLVVCLFCLQLLPFRLLDFNSHINTLNPPRKPYLRATQTSSLFQVL